MPSTMQRKKLDSRIPTLIANGVQNSHRSFFVMIGDRGRDQVVTLHYLLSKARVTARPSVLWCYKKELGFTSHRQKRAKQIKKQIAKGIRDADEDDPFELFVSSTSIRYAYYKETDKILGNTYGMLVLQDFEAITPNILARTIETVQGGGIVVLLLKSLKSLKQLYTMTMDVHSRYRTESHHETVARFNERFILSLGSCENCLVVDDELNILPLSAGKNVKPLVKAEEQLIDPELKALVDQHQESKPMGPLLKCAKTLDQGKALVTFVEAIAEKTLRSTVALTAARGRGKSAALGMAIAAAVAFGYSNIFITSPSPENLKTLFEFVFKGFDALGFEEHMDYDIIQSTNPDLQKAVVRVNIFKSHRQTIQYIQPSDYKMLAQAELLVIDEAAAIPMPIVKSLLGPYLVFMASTINGYEGTGRSLSIKLFQQLREQSKSADSIKNMGRTLKEITLNDPIRYGKDDPIESWLNKLLCLDCCTPTSPIAINGCPHPSACDLFYVNRDSLFSFHPVSEAFLQKMMNLYVSSHYKNSPNDLQLMSDAPAHHLFVLLSPITGSSVKTLPEPLVVVQVCLEGAIAKKTAIANLSKGTTKSGDLIPWVISQQYQDEDFSSLSGARIVRIATHPDYIGMGYGKRAMELLEDYYRGKFVNLNDSTTPTFESIKQVTDQELESNVLLTEQVQVRDPAKMPPLLLKLAERPLKDSEKLHWMGVSFGLTQPLHKFWKRLEYSPLYIRQTTNEITGEHTCIMMKSLSDCSNGQEAVAVEKKWLSEFSMDFKKRLVQLLAYQFKQFSPLMVLTMFEGIDKQVNGSDAVDSRDKLEGILSPFDIKRLVSYTNNLLDYHVVQDLVPTLAKLYFMNQMNAKDTHVKLSPVQAAILCGVGLQKKLLQDLEQEMNLPMSQILALFAKSVKKCANYFEGVVKQEISSIIGQKRSLSDDEKWDATKQTLAQDLDEAEDEAMALIKEQQRKLVDQLDLEKYAIQGTEQDWENAKVGKSSGIVNIPSKKSSKKSSLASDMAAELRGDKTGVFDPKNLQKRKNKKFK